MIEATFNGTDARVAQEFKALGPKVSGNLKRTLDDQTSRLWAHVVGKLASKLQSRTGRLAGSTRREPVRETETTIESSVQSARGAAFYGRVHEFGGTFTYSKRARRRGAIQVTAKYPERSYMRASLDDRRMTILEAMNSSFTKVVEEGNV